MKQGLKRQTIHALALWAGFLLLVTATSPDKLAVVVLILPFLLLLFAVRATVLVVMGLYCTYVTKTKPARNGNFVGWVLGVSLVGLLVMQSLGQLTVRDVLTLGAIVGIGYFYISYSRIGHRSKT